MRSHAHDECFRAQLACVRAQLLDLRQKNGGFMQNLVVIHCGMEKSPYLCIVKKKQRHFQ
jgi:hypothetical protein